MKDKNILYFTRTMNLGGTEKVILQLCEVMKDGFNKIIVCSSGGINVEKLTQMGIKHYYIPDIEKKDIKTFIKVFKELLNILNEENINIIHTHHRMAAFYTRVLKFIKRFIFINNSHNTFYDKKFLTRFSINRANNIAVGERVKENLCDFYGICEKNIKVIYNAVESFEEDVKPLEILQQYKEAGYFLVGNIGRISEQKGMEYFIKAAKLVLKKIDKIKFFIVGDGEDKEKIKKLIVDLNLENEVILLGYRNDIQNVMSQLDLIVLSSLWEGFPLTPIEAFSVKKTIIATNVDGTSEIVKNNFNGILVEASKYEQIKDGIIEMYNNGKMRESYEKNAYKTYMNNFTLDKFISDHKEYYKSIICK